MTTEEMLVQLKRVKRHLVFNDYNAIRAAITEREGLLRAIDRLNVENSDLTARLAKSQKWKAEMQRRARAVSKDTITGHPATVRMVDFIRDLAAEKGEP